MNEERAVAYASGLLLEGFSEPVVVARVRRLRQDAPSVVCRALMYRHSRQAAHGIGIFFQSAFESEGEKFIVMGWVAARTRLKE